MRRTALLLGAMLAALVALSGVAWAITEVRCPHDPYGIDDGTCYGTNGDDYVIGTDKADKIESLKGDDIVRGGRGPDEINVEGVDTIDGNDTNYGGPGDDRIGGQQESERHYGGGGDDILMDDFSRVYPDVFRCGDGYDRVYYNKGVDKVAADCEELHPHRP
jgi:Ca2+-binding RTX toxin-like protein